MPKVYAITMKEQDGKQIKGDVDLIHKSEEQALKSWTDNSVLEAVTRVAAAKDTTARFQPKTVIGTPLVKQGLQVIRVYPGFQITLEPLVVINKHWHKMFKAPFDKEANKSPLKQTRDIVLAKLLLQKFRNAKLGTIFPQRDRVGGGTNVK